MKIADRAIYSIDFFMVEAKMYYTIITSFIYYNIFVPKIARLSSILN